ncbi:SseB family protein [Mesobacterium sp. TK19101]|uniref:SseB family protein n=1 Tax=Mesobacterium hydrothermale TaxID=3111907 RepID=A0ABU6HN51_9RHOB|nr:SseB family protein [Mesobacterium sp. TK19101]MEC3862853.1 SseB family protein [Mesobacterium sp. TK19101]
MTDLTPLDRAHAAMDAAPEDDAARLRFYERLADSELFLLLEREAEGDTVTPELFDLSDARFILVFDSEDRLGQFVGKPAPYAAMSGRALANMLAGQGIGLGVNLEVAPSSILIPPGAVDWLVETLGHGPAEAEARPSELHPPAGLPDVLLTALDAKLATAQGMARKAYLAAVTYDDGTRGHLLGLTGALPGAERALAHAVNEALVFSGIEAGALDVIFLDDSDPVAAQLARVALRFDIPEPAEPERVERPAPGTDPDAPPILR